PDLHGAGTARPRHDGKQMLPWRKYAWRTGIAGVLHVTESSACDHLPFPLNFRELRGLSRPRIPDTRRVPDVASLNERILAVWAHGDRLSQHPCRKPIYSNGVQRVAFDNGQ